MIPIIILPDIAILAFIIIEILDLLMNALKKDVYILIELCVIFLTLNIPTLLFKNVIKESLIETKIVTYSTDGKTICNANDKIMVSQFMKIDSTYIGDK